MEKKDIIDPEDLQILMGGNRECCILGVSTAVTEDLRDCGGIRAFRVVKDLEQLVTKEQVDEASIGSGEQTARFNKRSFRTFGIGK